MNRVKVLVFALVAVGLWAAHLTMTSPALAAKAIEQASHPLLAASGAVAQRVEGARSELQAVALKLAANPVMYVKATGKVEAPTAERFAAIRAVAIEPMTDASKTTSYVIVSNEQGALMAQGPGDPATPPEGFDVKGAAAGGADGVLLELGGVPCLFFSAPLLSAVGGEVKPVGWVTVGGPLWGSFVNVDQLAEAIAKDLNLQGLGLWMKGKLVGAAGKREPLEKAFKATKPGQTAVVEQGAVMALGPLKLPMFVGTSNALDIAARRDIPGTPFEVVAIGTVKPMMETIANTQKMALFMLLGLLAAGIVFTLLVSSGRDVDDDDDVPLPSRPQTMPPMPAYEPKTRAEKVEPLPGSLASPPHPKEPTPDDFHFPPAPPPSRQEPMASTLDTTGPSPFDGPTEDPFATAGPVGGAPPPMPMAKPASPPPPLNLGDDDFDNQRTMAYPAHKMPSAMGGSTTDSHQALDPFSLAAGSPGALSDEASDYNPDATRVAAIPPELLKSARRDASTQQNPVSRQPPVSAPKIQSIAPVGAGSDEETHFQETFRDFLSTRQKCGEPNDGMTYDKFSAKLRKNKEQLVAKYNCRTVRFQVYVKDGKAALKATPVKD